jgi:DNA-binding IclR family transcriptional regulator
MVCGLWQRQINEIAAPIWSHSTGTFVMLTIPVPSSHYNEEKMFAELGPEILGLSVEVRSKIGFA